MKPEETIDFHLRNTWLKMAKYYNLAAQPHDGTLTSGFILLNIDVKNGTPSTQLGPKMGLEGTSLVRPLKTLEEKGLIYRKKDKEDKRVVKIFLTPSGLKKREISKETVLNINNEIVNQIGASKFKMVLEELRKIASTVEKIHQNYGQKKH